MNMKAKQKTRGLSFIILFCILSVVLFFTLTNTVAADQTIYKEVTVKHGDSLWSIATDYKDETPRLTKQAFIDWVKHENGLVRDQIVPDQKLIIPVKKENK
ncbi:cell division suppressor protein YneA [Sporolactobacillus inulinus]|uniref:LysM domain-containing protein n=1 Tax=Sporolactobacillus inulinus CASD TaxID=1069536 RepID=A0A0U1QS90_9BACL|nr:LysM peptidoglycan-binding domain-containing protein [Sporolactobacillus inulinus]KLI03669.1 hypothetical protein SINU_01420 [Sporolactobacillus inulinus CASD]GEB76003.1 cell division suppressor protein YneA [Sporolactobacillus inulinus]